MHRQIGAAVLQRKFKLLHEQSLAAHLAQRTVQDLITLGGHAQQAHRVAALLQHPDAGLFRSYYLRYALDAFVHPEIAEDPLEPTVGFVRRAAAAARRAGVPLTIVIIPEAAQVDDRFVELWAPLAELRGYLAPKRRVAEAAAAAWRADGLDVLDLHPILAPQRGAYLSLDGHLAAEGQHAVARAIAAP
jgi:hypothetical protein